MAVKNNWFAILSYLLLAISVVHGRGSVWSFFFPKASCSLLYTEFPDKEPVFLKSNYSLIEPNSNAITLNANEEILISCPGAKNTLLITNTNLASAKCVKTNILKIGTKQYPLSQLNCTKAVSGEVAVTTTACGAKKGVIKNIGHDLSNKFDILLDICYNDNRGEAIYAEHILYGSGIKNAKKESSRPGFKTSGLGPGVSADVAYKQATQKATFSQILGSSALAEKYINSKSFLARGHLSPDGDFVYVSSQFSSYFYINTVPQWQAVNNGNWKSLEFAVRNVAANMGKDLKVITGSHETMALPDTKGKLQEMFLVSKNKLPVPKFVWKILYSLETKKAIVFVSLNNPFVETVTAADILCKDICNSYGWGAPGWTNPAKGYQYCCDVPSFKKIVKTIPDLAVSGVLEAKTSTWFKYLY